MPVLVAQGTTDVQVGVEQAQALQAASPGAQLAIVPGMNHVLKLVPADMSRQLPSYADPTLPIAPQLVAVIVKFVHPRRPDRTGNSAARQRKLWRVPHSGRACMPGRSPAPQNS